MRLRIKLMALALLFVLLASTGAVAVSAQDQSVKSATVPAAAMPAKPVQSAAAETSVVGASKLIPTLTAYCMPINPVGDQTYTVYGWLTSPVERMEGRSIGIFWKYPGETSYRLWKYIRTDYTGYWSFDSYLPSDSKESATQYMIYYPGDGAYYPRTKYITVPLDYLDAEFKLTPNPPYVRDSVVFDASTSGGSSKITLYKWIFKDVSHGTYTTDRGKEVLHTFDKPGKYYVALEVYNSAGLKDTILKPIVVGDKWAVIVGINDYPHLSHIKGVESAREVRTFLMQKYNFDGSPGPQSHIISRINAAATRSGIMSALTELSTKTRSSKTSSHDLVVFYIFAHGAFGVLCPYDSNTDPKTGRPINDIYDVELGEMFAKIPSRATIIIINSCHSGSFVPQSTLIKEEARATTGFEIGVCGGAVQLPKIAKYIIMASSEDGELTYGGVFTTFLMHGFNKVGAAYYAKDTNHNNWLSIGESGEYASRATFNYDWNSWKVQVHPAIFISNPSRDLNVEYIGPLT